MAVTEPHQRYARTHRNSLYRCTLSVSARVTNMSNNCDRKLLNLPARLWRNSLFLWLQYIYWLSTKRRSYVTFVTARGYIAWLCNGGASTTGATEVFRVASAFRVVVVVVVVHDTRIIGQYIAVSLILGCRRHRIQRPVQTWPFPYTHTHANR